MSDYTAVATLRVEAINSPAEALSKTVWAYNPDSDIIAGQLMRTDADSETNVHKVSNVATKGNYVSHVIKTAYDASEVDLTEIPLEAFALTPGLQLIVPETALAADVDPHDFLIADTDGTWAARAAATDFVVGEALSTGTAGGTGHFRVQLVLSQIAG